MSERLARKFILSLSDTLKKEDFASLVSYFSITQGKGSKELPDLRLFPVLDCNQEKVKLTNRVKSELNNLGISTKRFNQGVRILEKVDGINSNDINERLKDYINNTDISKWEFLKDEKYFKLMFSNNDSGCFCKTTAYRTEYGNLELNQDRLINIDLLSLAKKAQAIHEELNMHEVRFEDTMDTIIYTTILHEKKHLYQRKLDDVLDKLKTLGTSHQNLRINFSEVSNFIKFYLSYEYEAWEWAYQKDLRFRRRKLINDALCNAGITSYVVSWLSEIYFQHTFTLPHTDVTFKIDPNAPDLLI